MWQVPEEQQAAVSVTVGKYPWRIPPPLRVCHEAVGPGSYARLLSPFSQGEPIPVTPDTSQEELYIGLATAEPAWSVGLMPVWPHLGANILHLVPIPGSRQLVCLVLVAAEWQCAVLVPRRADVPWLLRHLRRSVPGAIASIRVPLAVSKFPPDSEEAVDWRTGDVLLVFDSGDVSATYSIPTFSTAAAVRQSAIWSHDFRVLCDLPLVLWRPYLREAQTLMPGPSRWLASQQYFVGRFHDKYPGQWVPVPWAYADEVHMCLRAADPLRCNVIFESARTDGTVCHLAKQCIEVPSYATRESLSHMLQADASRLSVLSVDFGLDGDQPLRDGDIVHLTDVVLPTDAATGRSGMSGALVWVACLVLGAERYGGVGAGLCALAWWGPLPSPGVWIASGSSLPREPPPGPGRGLTGLWERLACYLAAWGAPSWQRSEDGVVSANLATTFRVQAQLSAYWHANPLRPDLPASFPPAYHYAWHHYPRWQGGVPDEFLLATDGSGLGRGSCAFVVWGLLKHTWYRVGWFATGVPSLAWGPASGHDTTPALRSFHGELYALQAAALWTVKEIDQGQLYMRTRPRKVTIAVDNIAALQIAAGHAAAGDIVARQCRQFWQSVQARCSTRFQHVHSHRGTMVNTLADALAGHAVASPWIGFVPWSNDPHFPEHLTVEGPWLWVIPRAVLSADGPILRVSPLTRDDDLSFEELPAQPACPMTVEQPPRTEVPLHLLTVNVQTLKDGNPNPFNPSGHAAKRQYYYDQFLRQAVDVACLQEARSRQGRWSTAGVLTWRAGASKGQYGCEIWVRPGLLQPPLTLSSFRILASSPRCIAITSVDPRLPLTIVSAHAPHAETC